MRALSIRITKSTPITCTPIAIHRQRLLNAARSVEEFDHSHDRLDKNQVDMGRYAKPCGSPACVLGHYASRPDMQDAFRLRLSISTRHYGGSYELIEATHGSCVTYDGPLVYRHFGLTRTEAFGLFSTNGCDIKYDGPVEPKRVVKFLRRFVREKWPQWRRRR